MLDVVRSGDEEIVCVSENDACGVDGIQVILGCTAGKGNLLFRLTGKHAYTFYNRKTQKASQVCSEGASQDGRQRRKAEFYPAGAV